MTAPVERLRAAFIEALSAQVGERSLASFVADLDELLEAARSDVDPYAPVSWEGDPAERPLTNPI